MPSNPPRPPGSCPVCRGTEFSLSSTGFPIKSLAYCCAGCGTRLKPLQISKSQAFRADTIGSEYSNASAMLKCQTWSAEELAGPDGLAAVYPDAELLQLAQGTIGPDLLTGDEDCQVPFPTEDGETVVFAIENIYSWENRPHSGQLAPGLKAFQVKTGEWGKLRILGEPRGYNLVETLDSGALYLTNQRYIFIGKRRRIDDDFSRIKAVLPFQDGFGVFRKDRSKIEFYKGDYYWPLVGAVLAGMAVRWRREHAARETRRDPGISE